MLKILIDGYSADYGDEKDLRLSLTYSIADINTIGARSTQGSRSYDIKLPATKNNKKLFGFVEDTNSTNGFDHTIEKTCYVEVDGSVVINGNARIKGVLNALGGIDYYSCVILGDTATWLNDIKDLSLTDLDFSDGNHVLNSGTIRTTYSQLSDDRDFIYPIINYGQWGATNTLSIFDINHSLHRFPAIKEKAYVTKILNAQGYTIKSDFIDSDYFGRLLVPFTAKNYDEVLDSSFRDDRLFRAKRTAASAIPKGNTGVVIYFPNDSTDGNFDNGSLYSTVSHEYTVDVNSIQEFVFNFELDHGIATNYSTEIIIERVKTNGVIEFLINAHDVDSSQLNTPTNIKTGFINVLAGEKIRCRVVNYYNYILLGLLGNVEQDLIIHSDESYFYNNVQLSYTTGNTVELSKYVPDINQLEYIKSLRERFNLHFLTDFKKRIVYIEPRDEFYRSTAIDWTDKLDISKGFKTSFLGANLTKEIELKYQDDSSDANLQKYAEDKGFSYGRDVVNIDNVNAKIGTATKSTPIFAPTFMQVGSQIGIDKYLPTMIKDLDSYEFSTSFAPRVLFYKQTTPYTATFKPTAYLPECYFFDADSSNDYGLQFNDETNTSGLTQRYHRNLYNTINKSRLIECEMYLTPTDVESFDFRNPISLIIGGEVTYYHINKISNYKPLEQRLTKVELLKVVNPIPKATITETTNILPPDGEVTPPSYVKVEINSITVDVKANINGSTKEIRK